MRALAGWPAWPGMLRLFRDSPDERLRLRLIPYVLEDIAIRVTSCFGGRTKNCDEINVI
jgi:hypothetical protein